MSLRTPPFAILLALLLIAIPFPAYAYSASADLGLMARSHGHKAANDGEMPWIAQDELPLQALETLKLIRAGGPFPYPRDGIVFSNREGRLPKRFRGYYQEYTVITPGRHDRGARRIISGKEGEFYYTDDHYRTFKRIKEQ
jgi:ribonuclease T1